MTEVQRGACVAVLQLLRKKPESKFDLYIASGYSEQTVQRALDSMRTAGAPIDYDRVELRWRLLWQWELPPELMPRENLEHEVRRLRLEPESAKMRAALARLAQLVPGGERMDPASMVAAAADEIERKAAR